MKLELDLEELLKGQEYSTVEEAVKAEVTYFLANEFKRKVGLAIDQQVTGLVETTIKQVLGEKLPAMLENLLELEYTPVDKFGRISQKTTLKAELIKTMEAQMVYTPDSYNKTIFTKVVDDAVRESLKKFQGEFNATVDRNFRKEALKYAFEKLKTNTEFLK